MERVERVQCPLENVLLETRMRHWNCLWGGGRVLRITGADVEFSPVWTKFTHRHVYAHTPTPLSQKSNQTVQQHVLPTLASGWGGAGLRRLQKDLVPIKSFGIRVIPV